MIDCASVEKLLGYSDLIVHRILDDDDGYHIYGFSSLSEGLHPQSLSRSTQVVQKRERVFREQSLFGKRVYLHITVRKFKLSSGETFWESLSFVRGRSRMTRNYEQYLYESCIGVDMSYVAQKEGLDVNTVSSLFQMLSKKN